MALIGGLKVWKLCVRSSLGTVQPEVGCVPCRPIILGTALFPNGITGYGLMELKKTPEPEQKRNLEVLLSGTCPRPHGKLVSPQTVANKCTHKDLTREFGEGRWKTCCQTLEYDKFSSESSLFYQEF